MEIKYIHGHYELYLNGRFVESADTWDEAADVWLQHATNQG